MPRPILFALAALLLGQSSHPPESERIARDLGALGIGVTRGAAPGYVEDRACATCHTQIAESYRHKGMARAFFRPRPATDIEDFSAPPFFHAPSKQYLQIRREGERLVFRRWLEDKTHLFETEVDWVLGSGNNVRTYLYRTKNGELFQLPLAWYTQTREWGMPPGYDRPDHEGVLRPVRRECLFCHNAYPELPSGADLRGAPQVFPVSMPEGLGCQRCHGPGAEHVWLASGAIASAADIRASIFNPRQDDDVCKTCHLQPSVAIPGLRRFGRGDFSYRAGERLSDYLVQVDVEEEGQTPAERFEINHHAYRLQQSLCQVGCLDCHDSHRVIPKEEMKVRVDGVCRGCHASPVEHVKQSDCASCHMPRRRTQDVVRVVMTDHRIQRNPGGPELLAPLSERDPILTDLRILDSVGSLSEIYRAAAVVRASGSLDAIRYLEKKLPEVKPAEPDPWIDLVQAQLQKRRFAEAEVTLAALRERRPDDPLYLEWLALARAGQGKLDEAIDLTRSALARGSNRVEAEYNLGRLLAAKGANEEAEKHLSRAVELKPNLVAGWFYLGEVRGALGRQKEAEECYRRALAIDPTFARKPSPPAPLPSAHPDPRERGE